MKIVLITVDNEEITLKNIISAVLTQTRTVMSTLLALNEPKTMIGAGVSKIRLSA